MIEEIRPAGAKRLLVPLDLSAPRARLEQETDVALQEMTRLEHAVGVVQTEEGAVEVVRLQHLQPGWHIQKDGSAVRAVDRVPGAGTGVVVNQDELVEQRLQVEFLNAQVFPGPGPI